MKKILAHAADALLVLCAVATTIIVARAYLRPRSVAASAVLVKNWRPLQQSPYTIGRADAPLRLVLWTDYQCPACRRFEREIDTLRARMPESLQVVVHQLPLREAHPLAYDAAVAAECGRRVGRFAAVHDALFVLELKGDSLPIATVAMTAGLRDLDRFRRCMADPGARAAIDRELANAAAMGGVQGTPTLLFRDTLTVGGMPADSLLARLRGVRLE